MTNQQRDAYVLRDGIINLVASVSTAETAEKFADGDEYIDLEQLDQGVLRAPAAATPMGRVLPRKAVHHDTWSKILMKLTRPDFKTTQPSQPAPTPRSM
jgi:hypothetical protein